MYQVVLPKIVANLLVVTVMLPFPLVWSCNGPVSAVPVPPWCNVQSKSSPNGTLIHSQNPPSKLQLPGKTTFCIRYLFIKYYVQDLKNYRTRYVINLFISSARANEKTFIKIWDTDLLNH